MFAIWFSQKFSLEEKYYNEGKEFVLVLNLDRQELE